MIWADAEINKYDQIKTIWCKKKSDLIGQLPAEVWTAQSLRNWTTKGNLVTPISGSLVRIYYYYSILLFTVHTYTYIYICIHTLKQHTEWKQDAVASSGIICLWMCIALYLCDPHQYSAASGFCFVFFLRWLFHTNWKGATLSTHLLFEKKRHFIIPPAHTSWKRGNFSHWIQTMAFYLLAIASSH